MNRIIYSTIDYLPNIQDEETIDYDSKNTNGFGYIVNI